MTQFNSIIINILPNVFNKLTYEINISFEYLESQTINL